MIKLKTTTTTMRIITYFMTRIFLRSSSLSCSAKFVDLKSCVLLNCVLMSLYVDTVGVVISFMLIDRSRLKFGCLLVRVVFLLFVIGLGVVVTTGLFFVDSDFCFGFIIV